MRCVIDHTLCRLCLCNSCRLVDIFEEQGGVEFVVKTVIEELLQLEVVKEVLFPWMVCSSCMEKLSEFYLFKRRCIESQHVYDNRVKRGKFSKPRGRKAEHEKLPVKTEPRDSPDEVPKNDSSSNQDPFSDAESHSLDKKCIQLKSFNGATATKLQGLSDRAPGDMNLKTSPRTSGTQSASVNPERRRRGRQRMERDKLIKVGEDSVDTVVDSEHNAEPFVESTEESFCVDDGESVVNCTLPVAAPSALSEEILPASGEESVVDVSTERGGLSGLLLFRCYECGEGFERKKRLTQHMKEHSAGWMHCCIVCGKSFPQKSTLDMHMILHSVWGKRYSCSECRKSFVKRKELDLHVSLQHKSSIRGDVTRNVRKVKRGSLRKSVSLNHGKCHRCRICSKSFYQKSTLREHMSTHDQLNPVHRCLLCSKSFTRASWFKLHMSLHKELPCDVCHRVFSREISLKRHMSTHGR